MLCGQDSRGQGILRVPLVHGDLEAVREVVNQLRFRNIGGLIIIDLIDMESAENRDKVYRALQEALRSDKSKTNILKISELGLVEMTRKRTRENLVQQLCQPCPHCEGRGYVLSPESVAFKAMRENAPVCWCKEPPELGAGVSSGGGAGGSGPANTADGGGARLRGAADDGDGLDAAIPERRCGGPARTGCTRWGPHEDQTRESTGDGAPRRTQQIAIHGRSGDDGGVNWKLVRVTG